MLPSDDEPISLARVLDHYLYSTSAAISRRFMMYLQVNHAIGSNTNGVAVSQIGMDDLDET